MMTRFSLLLIIFILVSLCPSTSSHSTLSESFTRSITLYAPAVSRGGGGALIQVNLTIKYPGSGRLFFSAKPLVELDTQATARIASYVAAVVTGHNYYDYDYYVVMTSQSLVVGGPSAGALMTIGFTALFLDKQVNENISITGMINPDGSIGPVGGLLEKLDAVANHGYKVFLIPLGQRIIYVEERKIHKLPWGYYETITYKPVDLVVEGAKRGIAVVEVSNIFEAMKYFLNITPGFKNTTIKLTNSVASLVNKTLSRNNALINIVYGENKDLYSKLDPFTQIQLRKYYTEINAMKNTLDKLVKNKYYLAATQYSYKVYRENLKFNWIIRYLRGELSINNINDTVNKTLNKVYELLSNITEHELNMYLIDAYENYYLAMHNYLKVLRNKNSYSVTDLFNILADTYVRLLLAKDQVELGKKTTMQPINVLTSILMLYSIADSIISYAYSLTRDIGSSNNYIDYGIELFDKAIEAYRENYSIAVLGLLVDSIVYVDLGIERLFTNNVTVISNITWYLERELTYYINIYGYNDYIVHQYRVACEYYDNELYDDADYYFLKTIIYTISLLNTTAKPKYVYVKPVIHKPNIPVNKYSRSSSTYELELIVVSYVLGIITGVTVIMVLSRVKRKEISIFNQL